MSNLHPPRPIVDYADPVNTRSERRHTIFWRCAWTVTALIVTLSIADVVTSVIAQNDRVAVEARR